MMMVILKKWYEGHKILCRVGLGMVLFYTLAGFAAAPLAVRHVLENQVAAALKRDVHVKTVRVNPFSFSMRLAELSVMDHDQEPFLKWGHLHVNVDPLISLIKWGIAVKSVDIAKPEVRIVRLAASQFNFSDLITPPVSSAVEDNAPTSGPVRVILKALNLSDGEVRYADKSQSQAFDATLSSVSIGLKSVDTASGARPAIFEMSARSDAFKALAISGQANAAPMSVSADVQLKGIPVARYAPYYDAYLNADVADGTVGFQANVRWSQDVNRVGDILLTLANLALNDKAGEPLVAVEHFEVDGASIDMGKQDIQLGRVSTRKGRLNLRMDEMGRFNLQTAFTPAATREPVVSENEAASVAESAKGWEVHIPEFKLDKYRVRYEDRQTSPRADIALNDVQLEAKGLSTRKNNRGKASLRLNWPEKGTLGVQGDVGLTPLSARMAVAADALDIRPLQPYISPHLRLVVTSGRFDAKGTLQVDTVDERTDVQYTGMAAVNHLNTLDKEKTSQFLNWKSLYLDGVEYVSHPFRLNIGEVALTDFFSRLMIHSDGSSNLASIVNPGAAGSQSVEEENRQPVESGPSTDKGGTSPINIKTITLQGGRLDFSDRFVKPNVRLPMAQIAGRISGLDTLKENKADVLLSGIVGRNVPVQIKGRINPLTAKPFVDLTIDLAGVDLSPFAPYSGKYLGYTLEKGQLSLDLAYRVNENKLTAQNKVSLNQLTLGDTVESPSATKLPIKLALGLLKDRKGNIDLDLPMTGDLDDPEFSIGGIVAKMFSNLIVNIVRSPFAALGALFGGGGEELAYLDFEHGGSVIPEDGIAKLETLTKILIERPGLKMEIQGQVDPEKDTDGLRRQRFEQQLQSMKLKSMIKKRQKAVPLEQIEVTGKERDGIVRKIYADAQLPKPRDEKGKVKKINASQMEVLLYSAVVIGDDDLRLLAHQRSLAAKQYFVEKGQVAADRLFIVEPNLKAGGGEEALRSRVVFNLDAP